jgi:cardiolipin synthase
MKNAIVLSLVAVLAGCGVQGLPGSLERTHGGFVAAGHKVVKGGHAVVSGGPHQLYIMPDMGTAPVLAAIQNAKTSIHMEMYMLTQNGVEANVLAALEAQAKAGKDVSIILDASINDFPQAPSCQPPVNPQKTNQAVFDLLTAAGAKVKWANPAYRFTHQKSMVIDNKMAYIMTMNLSDSAFTRNREYIVADQDPADVNATEAIFQADWTEQGIAPTDPNLAVSPSNSRERIIALIDSAKKSLVFQVEFLSDSRGPNSIAAHLAARVKAGVDVTGMMAFQPKDPCSNRDANAAEAQLMGQLGIAKFAFPQKVTIHAKAIVVDGSAAYIGSENFTANSLDNNRELGIITADATVVAPLLKTMVTDWANKDQPAPARTQSLLPFAEAAHDPYAE